MPNGDKTFKRGIIAIVVFFVVVIILFTAFYIVPAGHRGVFMTFGKPSMIARGEGIGIKIPIAQRVLDMEVRVQKIEVLADSASQDLQDVATTIALNFHVLEEEAPLLYQKIGLSYDERIIIPAIHESVRAVTAKFVAEDLIRKRPEVRNEMKELLKVRLLKSSIVVDDFNIVNFQFSEEFDKAIEAKVTAEQLKLKADRDLERIKVEKQQIITQAQAEAEALRIQKKEITPELIQLRKIEMMKMAINKWDGHMPQATTGMPFIDVSPQFVETEE